MTKLYARFWGTLLFAFSLVVGMISPVFAAPPVTKSYVLQSTQVLADCGSFQVMDDYNVNVTQKDYYDQNGNRIEIHQAIHGTDTYRHSVTGQAITMGSHFMVHIDMQTMLNSSSGLQYHLLVPGLGNVFLDAGRTVYDLNAGEWVFLAGPHQVATGDTASLCSAFS